MRLRLFSQARWQRIVKRSLPTTLFGRSLLIIILPVAVMQIAVTWAFFDAHWRTVTSRLSDGLAGDVAWVADSYKTDPASLPRIAERAERSLDLSVAIPAGPEGACGAPGFHPLADGIALEGMRLVAENLPAAVKDGKNLVARANMMAAASMGATAFQKGLGGMHAISHPLGALYNTHHGLTNAVVMPYVLDFNREAIDERMTRLARFLGLGGYSASASG